ncbi:MAG TPA: acetate--CoA ligase family protein [Pseudonocardiaceae bacterium]
MPADLARLLSPRSIAIVGAREASPTSYGVIEALHRVGFAGPMFAVNRAAQPAHGLPTVATCAQIGEPVDAAVLLVPARAVAEVLEDVGAAGIGTAVVFSSGWAESGADGTAGQRALAERAQALGITLIGPNCLGFMNITARTGAWIASVPPNVTAGPVAIVSQSGGIGNALADLAAEYGTGLSHVVTTGNEAMLTTTDVVEYLVDEPETRSIAVFAEAIAEPDRFLSAAVRARELGKAIVILKAGSSELAARNAVSHTASLVGDDRVVDAALRQAAAIRVRSLEELVVTAAVTARAGVLRSPGVAVVSMSGGSVDVIADEAARLRLELPQFNESSVKDIRGVVPGFASVQNPLDLTGGSLGDEFERVLKIVDRQDDFGVVAVLCNVPAYDSCKTATIEGLIDTVSRGLASITTPGFVLSQTVSHLNAVGRSSTNAAGVAALPGIAIGSAALANLTIWSAKLRGPQVQRRPRLPEPRSHQPCGALSEWSARQLLEPAGVPFVPAVLAHSPAAAVAAAARFGEAVAVKLVSPDVAHKSDIGAVRLGVYGDVDVRRAFEEVIASAAAHVAGVRVEGVQISPMRRRGVELLVGVSRDPQWGLVLAVGLGGVLVEVLEDVALRLLPVSAPEIDEMLGELRGAKVLDGARGEPRVDRAALVAAIAHIADAAWQLGHQLESLEINPLRADAHGVEALDALVMFRTAS